MCKHKSGGMSRPSATANQTENIASNNNVAACDNDQLDDETSSTSNNQQESTPLHPLQLIPSSLQESSETRLLLLDISPNMGVQSAENSVGRDLCGVQQMTLNSASSMKPNNSSTFKWNAIRRENESDEDHISEKSPMLGNDWNSPLLEKSCDLPAVCICDGTSNSYIDFGHSCSNYPYPSCSGQNDKYKMEFTPYSQYNIPNSLLPRSFRNLKGGGCAVVEKDFIELTEENPEEIELSSIHGCDCSTRSEKKWLFSRHKCHSLDSSTKPTKVRISNSGLNKSRSLAQNISVRPMENIEESSLEKSTNDNYSFPTENFANDSSVAGPSQIQRPSSIHGVSENAKEYEEEEFRSRSFSLTPTISFAIFESESSSDTEESIEQESVPATSENYNSVMPGEKSCMPPPIGLSLPIVNRTLPGCPSAAQLSLASSLGDGPICKICHMSAKDGDQLISPCRCAGTMQYIHCGCLMRWLEISSKKSRKPPSCELCQYQYQWHKKFKVRHWQFPHCSRRDKILHLLFFISVIVMVTCATITIMCFKQDKGTRVDPDRTELTQSEIVTLVCGVLFFLAFFVAMYVEVKARNTIYKLLAKFIYLNQQWYIDEYDKKDSAPVAV
ncbi:uncharacterized protein [Centruroides vittatus]|uniref:uncharacterized protein n=1 Tax=Centruroides vittatus TaxID=120091 RepID=UPI00350EBBEA